MPLLKSFILIASLTLCCGRLAAKTTRFDVKDAAFRNVIQWTSDAPLEKIVATSHYIGGWIEIDPQNLKAGVKGDLEIDVRSFEMGPDSRQIKLRETLFASAEHPGAFYKVDRLIETSEPTLTPGKRVSGRVSGLLSLRGVSRRHDMHVRVTYLPESESTKKRLPGNLLKVSAAFDLALSEVKFVIPDAMKGLLAPVFRVNVDLMGTDHQPVGIPP